MVDFHQQVTCIIEQVYKTRALSSGTQHIFVGVKKKISTTYDHTLLFGV